jgi:cyclase
LLKKRVIGVITVRDNLAIQSIAYQHYLPLGNPLHLVENLDRWGADEILLQVIDRSDGELGPDFELMEKVGKLGIATPIIYGGGIRSESDGARLISLGADRLVVDTLLHKDCRAIVCLSKIVGAQAIIVSLPMTWSAGRLGWYDYRSRTSKLIDLEILHFLNSEYISEILLTDWENEGRANGFSENLIDNFPATDSRLILFGGLNRGRKIRKIIQNPRVAAVAVGTFLNYEEHALQKYKRDLVGLSIRDPVFNKKT